MSEKLIKPYEISVWEDKLIQDGNEYKFIEKKLAVIGSDTMTGLNKVYNPVFNKKSNGEKSLTFSLKYKYFDPYLGNDEVVNPFAALLINERKVKLHYDNEWYEFIIKDHTESSDGYEWTYTCTDAFVLELSKVGYNITFDTELNNNQGTALELTKETIKNTDWRIGSINSGQQLIAEPIYKAILVSTSGVEIINASGTSETPPAAQSTIYVFYNYVKNQGGKFIQFIIRDDNRQYTIDDRNVITDTNFRIINELVYKENQYIEVENPTGNPEEQGWYENNNGEYVLTHNIIIVAGKTYYKKINGFYYKNGNNYNLIIELGEVETHYQANRLAYNQRTTYDSVMERTVDRFQAEGGDLEVYRYVDSIYSTSDVLTSYITNGENFNMLEDGSLQGWNPYVGGTDQAYGNTIKKLELVTKPELGIDKPLVDLLTLSEVEGYLKVQFNGALTEDYKNTIYNSGFENNVSFIQSVSKGEKFVFRWRAREGSVDSTAADQGQGLRAIVAKYTQDTPTPYHYYYKHIDPNNIILNFTLEQGETLQELNNIITDGILKIAYRATNDKAIVSGKTYYTRTEVDDEYIYTAVVSPVPADLNIYYEQYYNYVVDNVVQTPSTKYIYNNATAGDAPAGDYLWDGANQTYIPKSQGYYLPYYYLVAEATKTVPNSVLSDSSQKYGIFIYNVTGEVTYFIQDIQLTRFIADEGNNGKPMIIGNVPTATTKLSEYYYLKPSNNTVKEDIKTYASIEALQEDLGISDDILPMYNEDAEKVLSISASQSNCFNILQTIAETFECWVELDVKHDNNGYILYDSSGLPQKYVNLREYIGKDNWAGFKYGINLQSIERNINSDEIVTKLIVDQSQSDYVDEGFISIVSAPSNISGESYILNFDYYYSQGLLDREKAETDRLEFITQLAEINAELQAIEEKRRNYANSFTKLSSDRNVYTELVSTAQDNQSLGLEDFQSLTSLSYENYQEKQTQSILYEDNYYILTTDVVAIEGKPYYRKTGSGTSEDPYVFTLIDDVESESPSGNGWYEILINLMEEDTLIDVLGEIYINSATINNYSGLLTNVEQEYQAIKQALYGLDDYNIKVWVDYDVLNNRHVYVELNDYLPGFSFMIDASTYTSTVSKKFFDIRTDATNIVFQAFANGKYKYVVNNEETANFTYSINDNVTIKFKLKSVNTVEGVTDQIDDLIEQKTALIKAFENKYQGYIQEGSWNSTDYIDSELYYLDALQVSNTSAQPTVSYTINVVEISQLEGFEWYLFDVGDKTYVEDTEFFGWTNINVGTDENSDYVLTPAREEVIVSEVEWYLENPTENTITVQNYKTRFEDLFQRISATVQTVQYNEATYAKISSLIDANGTINQDVLLDSLNNLSGKQYSLTSNGSVIIDDDNVLIQNLTNPANRVIINSKGIRVSSDGGETWTTAIDGYGINIGTVYTGSLNTNEIVIGNKDYPSFRWDKSGISAYHVNESNIPDEYILTEDTVVIVDKTYYILVRSGYTPVPNPTGNPHEQGWYELKTENFTDLKTFVRFDEYGLYGIKNAEKFKAQQLNDITENAHFAVTWDGFFIKNSYADGGRVSITSDNDFQITKTADGNEQEIIKIGMLELRPNNVNGNLYGMRIKGANNTDALIADSNGNLSITGTINALGGNFSNLVTVGKNTEETTDYIKIDGASASISSSNYNAGPSASATQGWIINKNGDAVFNNIIARGSIKTAVFEYAEIQAVGGIFIFRPSSTIRSATVNENNLILTVEKQHLFSVDDWVKISNYTTDGSEPDASYTLQENGLTHVYRVSAVNNRNVTLENAAAMVEGNNKIVDIENLFGGALVSMGHYESGIDSNNYGIGINSSDNTVNLARRAISLFETEIKPNAQDGIRVKYNYRGILGTLPPMSSGVYASIYNHMQGTQGIYTDNMYIGDENQYLAFYNDGSNKKLEIRADEILFKKNGEYKNVANAIDATQGGHFIFKGSDTVRYVLTEDTEVDPNKTYYIYDDVSEEYVEAQLDPTDNPSELDCYERFISTYSGAGVIQNDSSNPAEWGYNTWIGANGIQLRTGEEAYATLNVNGLILNKGGIKAGEPGEDGFVYVSSDSYGKNYSINNTESSDWKQIIGNRFGIRSDGTLYTTGAHIAESIEAENLRIGQWTTFDHRLKLCAGTYNLSNDTEVQRGKVYFELKVIDGIDTYKIVIPGENDNPHNNGWRELVQSGPSDWTNHKDQYFIASQYEDDYDNIDANTTIFGGNYYVTEDRVIDNNKIYYERTGSGTELDPFKYTVVEEPTIEDDPHEEGWYELQKLFYEKDMNSPQMIIGNKGDFAVTVDNTQITFWYDHQKVAFINGDRMQIPRSVMLEEMLIGQKKWSWREHEGNLQLKWIGD